MACFYRPKKIKQGFLCRAPAILTRCPSSGTVLRRDPIRVMRIPTKTKKCVLIEKVRANRRYIREKKRLYR